MADEEPGIEADDLDKAATDEAQLAKRWIAEIAAAEKQQSKWVDRAKKIEKIYADDRDTRSDRARKFNILWSNVETLRPAVYMQTPKARAVRRYRDKDPEARFGALLIERGVETSCELYDFDHAMDQAVRDRLVVGRGQCWVFYQPNIVGEGKEQALAYEDVQADYVPWPDFLHSVCRTWSENWWVGRRFYKSRAELKPWMQERGLDPRKAAFVAMDVSPDGDKTDEGLKDERARACIWEIWSKRDGKVLYVAPGSNTKAILGVLQPPVAFRDFFPCPRPMLATTTARSLIPTPDYALYQDQAEELNRITARIASLQQALKLVGVYDATNAALANLIEASDGKMIPVENWAMFKEGGGSAGNFELWPVDRVAEVLTGLYEMQERAKQTLYEVSGIGDILRGVTDPDETAMAQGIKSKWGSLRVRRIQKDVQRFAADIMRLKAEVITEQFAFSSLTKMAGVDEELLSHYVPEPPPPQIPPAAQQAAQQDPAMAQQMQAQAKAQVTKDFLAKVEAMLRDDTSRNFRINVESDSTLEPDAAEEKQTAVEFATSMSAFLKEAAPMMMNAGPEVAKMMGEILLFVVRRFGAGVEQLEKTIEQVVEAASQPKPPQPDPEMVKAEAKVKETQAKIEGQQQMNAAKIEGMQQQTQAKIQGQVMETQAKLALQGAEAQQQAAMNEQQMAQQAAQGDLQIEMGEQKMSIAERAAAAKRAQANGAPPE